jgi:hypothetical protein
VTGYTPIPVQIWTREQLHRLYDDVVLLTIPFVMQEQLQRLGELQQLAELEFEAEERDECPK